MIGNPKKVLDEIIKTAREICAPPRICFENRERSEKYYIPREFYKGRKPGLSAMIRLKNEEEWIRLCLLSIKDWFDEIIVTLQNSTDRTEEIIREMNLPHLKTYHYPFDSFPNGPGHDAYPLDSVHTRAYYYNWSLAKTTRQWVCKWDGDMVALDWLGERIRELMKSCDIIRIHGVDIVGEGLRHVGDNSLTGSEPRFFRVYRNTFYYSGERSEVFSNPRRRYPGVRIKYLALEKSAFLHFKWAKSFESAIKAWPKNWRETLHFQGLVALKGTPKKTYDGEYPSVVREILEQRRKL